MFILADYILVSIALGSGILFMMLGANTLYKFYLGIVIGFLLFLVFNSQIDLLENLYIREISPFQSFLVQNKELVITLCILSIPLLGILSAANQSFTFHGRRSTLGLLAFGGLLPLFLVGLLTYIGENLYTPIGFFSDILSFFENSFFFEFFRENLSWVIYGLLFLIFYKAIFLLLFAFIAYMYEVMREEFLGAREKEEGNDDEDIEE